MAATSELAVNPAVSEAQRKYLYSHFGADWAEEHHFDNRGKLPRYASKSRSRRVKRDAARNAVSSVDTLLALQAGMEAAMDAGLLENYDPEQLRDVRGQWTAAGAAVVDALHAWKLTAAQADAVAKLNPHGVQGKVRVPAGMDARQLAHIRRVHGGTEEASEPGPAPAPVLEGKPQAHVEPISESNAAVIRKYVGKPLSEGSIAALGGDQPGSDVSAHKSLSTKGIVVDASGKAFVSRLELHREGKQLVCDYYYIRSKADSPAMSVVPSVLAKQFKEMQALGVKRVMTDAGRHDTGSKETELIGYKVWPKFGFDAPVPMETRASLPELLRSAHTVQDLYQLPGGRQAWEQHGRSTVMQLDMADAAKSSKIIKLLERIGKAAPAANVSFEQLEILELVAGGTPALNSFVANCGSERMRNARSTWTEAAAEAVGKLHSWKLTAEQVHQVAVLNPAGSAGTVHVPDTLDAKQAAHVRSVLGDVQKVQASCITLPGSPPAGGEKSWDAAGVGEELTLQHADGRSLALEYIGRTQTFAVQHECCTLNAFLDRVSKSAGTDTAVRAAAHLLEQASNAAQQLIEVPDIRQPNHYWCGACATYSCLLHFGAARGRTLAQVAEELGTTQERSTLPAAIVAVLRSSGLQVAEQQGMSISDLAHWTERGWPVVCPVQDYGDRREPGADFAYGHYLTVLGVGMGYVFCQDSSIENAELQPGGDVEESEEAERNIDAPGRIMVYEDDWLRVWHDEDAEGQQYEQYGIAVGPPLQANVDWQWLRISDIRGADPSRRASPIYDPRSVPPVLVGPDMLLVDGHGRIAGLKAGGCRKVRAVVSHMPAANVQSWSDYVAACYLHGLRQHGDELAAANVLRGAGCKLSELVRAALRTMDADTAMERAYAAGQLDAMAANGCSGVELDGEVYSLAEARSLASPGLGTFAYADVPAANFDPEQPRDPAGKWTKAASALVSKLHSWKFTPEQLHGIATLNPEGLQGGKVKVPSSLTAKQKLHVKHKLGEAEAVGGAPPLPAAAKPPPVPTSSGAQVASKLHAWKLSPEQLKAIADLNPHGVQGKVKVPPGLTAKQLAHIKNKLGPHETVHSAKPAPAPAPALAPAPASKPTSALAPELWPTLPQNRPDAAPDTYVGKPLTLSYIGTPQDLHDHGKAVYDALPKSVQSNLRSYTGGRYSLYNKEMRKCPPEFECLSDQLRSEVTAMDDALHQPLPRPAVVWRGIVIGNPAVKTAMLEDARKHMAEGRTYKLPSFTSTSFNAGSAMHAFGSSVVYRIVARTGLPAKPFSQHKYEDELLQSSRCQYRVAGAEVVTAGKHTNHVIYLEEMQ
jgi:hypothetical protein